MNGFSNNFYRILKDLEDDTNYPQNIKENDPRLIALRIEREKCEKKQHRNKNAENIKIISQHIKDGRSIREISASLHIGHSQVKRMLVDLGLEKEYMKYRKLFKTIYVFDTDTEKVETYENRKSFCTHMDINQKRIYKYVNTYKQLGKKLIFDYSLWKKVGINIE